MNDSLKNFYSESSDDGSRKGPFHKVISLHEDNSYEWRLLSQEIPVLPRGWYELSRFPKEDRIEFTRDYWFSKLSSIEIDEEVISKLIHFFEEIEDIGIFATQQMPQAPFEAHMVYSLKNAKGFFHGYPPASRESVQKMITLFPQFNFPVDYLSFFEIHDGFSKYIDTGLFKVRDIAKIYLKFQSRMNQEDWMFLPEGHLIDPQGIIPFYESSTLHCYQCFYAGWFPGEEMGNICYSEDEKLISDFLDSNNLNENLAFTTFSRWLAFYLEEFITD